MFESDSGNTHPTGLRRQPGDRGTGGIGVQWAPPEDCQHLVSQKKEMDRDLWRVVTEMRGFTKEE